MKKIKVSEEMHFELYKLLYILYGVMLGLLFMDIYKIFVMAVFCLYVIFFLVFIEIPKVGG